MPTVLKLAKTKRIETNEEFISRIMNFSNAGPLIQAFIIEGIAKYAQQVKDMPQDQRDSMNNGFISYAGWERCADSFLAEVADKYGK